MGTLEVSFPSGGPAKLLKWRIRIDTMVSVGRVLFLYQNLVPGTEDVKGPEKKYRATTFGRVKKLLIKEGAIIEPGQVIMTLEGCKHPTVMKDLCAECGVDLRVEGGNSDGDSLPMSQASVPMVHSIPELKVCPELAEKIGKEDEERLLKDRKLALLVDLDQTIVHTTNDNIPPNMKDVYHYQLYGPNSPWYHTRLRPNTRHFLSEMSRLYELHICTFGARNYAHTVAALLDKDGTLFSHRILSRDECFDPASKTANLKALFPCGDDLVCIIDDREDVWQGCGNLVQVKAYHFFRHTGDIHAPPGLEKNDLPLSPEPPNLNEPSIQRVDNENGVSELSTEEVAKTNNEVSKEEISLKEESESVIAETQEKNAESNLEDKSVEPSFKGEGDIKNDNDPKATNQDELPVESDKKVEEPETAVTENKVLDEDDDDYLLYLEDILRRIHTEFYTNVDQGTGRTSLRDIIPRVRGQVLKGVHLTFSGLIPTHQKLHQSRAYKVARAFGAEVAQDLTDKTTHLVAIKPGTAKANVAKRNGNIKIVNSDWLWTCAERWEHVDERLFPLTAKGRASRIPPPHCSSPEHVEEQETLTDSFADSINPLMSFTPEEIEIMDKEVEEDMEDQEMDASIFDAEDSMEECSTRIRRRSSESEESANYEQDDMCMSVKKKKKLSNDSSDDENSSVEKGNNCRDDEDDDDDDDDDPVTRFRRGEDLPDDLDLGDNSQDSIDDLEATDNEDEREWNAMGAALEREFLSE
ncbi:hypothetical protein KM043_004428 [Ampulex compressa]|nr:hypothetical protein KM043_004428 [Ampulex compressa]